MNLSSKAEDLGIETEFFDGQGQRRVTDAAALKIILDALPARTPNRFVTEPIVIRSGGSVRSELAARCDVSIAMENPGRC